MAQAGQLSTTTIREFSGGLNIVTDDLNMDTRFSKIETNVFNKINGTKAKRYGTKYLVNVKSYPQIEETFDTVNNISKHIVTIPQDTIHDVDLDDTITISTPLEIAGTYSVIISTSASFIVELSTTPSQQSYNNINFIINSDNKSQTVSNGIVSNNRLIITKFPNSNVTPSGIIDIIEPVELAGTYTPIANTDNDFNIEIDGSINLSTLTDIKYTYSRDLQQFNVTRYAANFTYTTKNRYEFTGGNVLLIGQKITITEPLTIAGDYTVIASDTSSYQVDAGNDQNSYTNVTIVHDNRNIQGDYIVGCEYFLNKIIFVTNIGEVGMLDAQMNCSIIFNNDISHTINPESQADGWSDTDSVCFTVFNGILTLWNGKDKPLAVDLRKNIPCNYLYDEGTGSNANVPIAKYALGFNHYLIAANIYDEYEAQYYNDRISISARDSIGTFYDPTGSDYSNDAVYLDLGKIISSNSQTIKGIARYRNKVAVGFDDATVFGTLGNYVETTDASGITIKEHVPNFEDVVSNHGCIANKTFANLKSELVCLDYSGLPLFKSSSLTTQILPSRISERIAPELYQNFTGLYENVIENKIFSIVNPKDNQYLLFIPDANTLSEVKEYICYAYTMTTGATNSIRDGAWSKFTGWNFQCGCTSVLNEVFLIDKTKIYQLGNIDNQIYSDFMDDPNYPAQDDDDISGKAIDFEWEFPWTDFGARALTKHTRYIQVSSTGIANFNLDMFLDYVYYDVNGNKNPQLSLSFVGGDGYGYGHGIRSDYTGGTFSGVQLYGAGRRTNSELLFAYPAKFKIAKLNINGSSKFKLNINSITIYYQRGNIRR